MKISLNFYLDELKPTKYYLTVNNLVIVSVISIFAMVIWIGILHSNLQESNKEISVLNQKAEKAQSLLTKLQQDLIKHNDKATFNDQKLILEKKLNARNLLWEGVGKRLQMSTVDYYLVMKDLTEHHEHDLWLSKFTIDQTDITFTGFALDTSAVTRWMGYLQSSQSFQGREFSHLNIKSEDDELMSFEVATSITSSKEKAATK